MVATCRAAFQDFPAVRRGVLYDAPLTLDAKRAPDFDPKTAPKRARGAAPPRSTSRTSTSWATAMRWSTPQEAWDSLPTAWPRCPAPTSPSSSSIPTRRAPPWSSRSCGGSTTLPFGPQTTPLMWELKVIGLAVIFVYAFFKFAWSYRLFNYVAIIVGSVPVLGRGESEAEAAAVARRAGALNVVAGRHFNRGQRAFFFALAYLGWFVSPYAFMAGTGAVLFVMWRRQFASDAREALIGDA